MTDDTDDGTVPTGDRMTETRPTDDAGVDEGETPTAPTEATFLIVDGVHPTDLDEEQAEAVATGVQRSLQAAGVDAEDVEVVANKSAHDSMATAAGVAPASDRVPVSDLEYGDVISMQGRKRVVTAFPGDVPMIHWGEVGTVRYEPDMDPVEVGVHDGACRSPAIDRVTEEGPIPVTERG